MWKKILNPFHYLPLRQAWCWGIAAMILAAIFSWQVGLRATSLTQINYLGDALWAATLRQVILWLLFSVVLYVGALIFSKSKVRFVDVAAFNMFARIPFYLTLLVFAFPSIRHIVGLIMDSNLDVALQHSNILSIVGIVSMVGVVWYLYWNYKAFAEATNLKGGKGVAVFAVGYVVTYIASGYVMILF